jgi:hypothetical protein
MSVTFIPIGLLKNFVNGAERITLERKEGKSLEVVCWEIGLPANLAPVFIVNGEIKNKDYLLRSNDEVKIIAILGGG